MKGGKIMPDKTTILSRERGTLPDWAWYQLNGKTAQENYAEQKAALRSEEDENEEYTLVFESEVKQK